MAKRSKPVPPPSPQHQSITPSSAGAIAELKALDVRAVATRRSLEERVAVLESLVRPRDRHRIVRDE